MGCGRRKAEDHSRDLIRRRREMFRPALEAAGLAEAVAGLPQALRHAVYAAKLPPIRVRADASAIGAGRLPEVLDEVRQLLDEPCVDPFGDGRLVSPNDYFCYLTPLHGVLKNAAEGPDPARAAAAARVGRLLDASRSGFHQRLQDELRRQLLVPMAHKSRVDERVFWSQLVLQAGGPKVGLDVLVRSEPARRHDFRVDGETRPAFQAGVWAGTDGVVWIEWDRDVFRPGAAGKAPVFVQSHAVRRMFERLLTPADRDYVHAVLTLALVDRQVVRRDPDGSFWVACHLYRGPKLGYLVGTEVDGKVLIRTFLFLTMRGTPEAARLAERLGTRRADIEHLRLDELATFVDTDLGDDRELVDVFDDCGCGHLFGLREEWSSGAARRGHAANVRSYLRMATRPADGPPGGDGEAG